MNLLHRIGHTPLIRLSRLETTLSLNAAIYAKAEMFNPFGSIKDRTAYALLKDPALKPGMPIAEATSGNLGVSLAAIGQLLNHPVHLFIPENMPSRRMTQLQAYGAALHLTPVSTGMKGAIDALETFASQYSNIFLPHQFTNPRNTQAHAASTGPEIADSIAGVIHHLVAGVGTGGTLMGTAQYLLTRYPHLHITAVEPASSPVLSGGPPGAHHIYGIGAGFVPPLLDMSLIHSAVSVTDDQVHDACVLLAKTEALFCGPSSGAALHAAIRIARSPANNGHSIVVILPDSGVMYLT